MANISTVGIRLKNKLLEYNNDKEFAICVMANSKKEDNWKIILEKFETNKEMTKESLLLFSLSLGEKV